ncbi:hypothetical protein [Caproiciproducens sp.]
MQSIKNRRFVGSDIVVDIPPTILLHESSGFSGIIYFHAEQGIRQLRPTNLQLCALQNGSMPIGLTSFCISDFPGASSGGTFSGAVPAAPFFVTRPSPFKIIPLCFHLYYKG